MKSFEVEERSKGEGTANEHTLGQVALPSPDGGGKIRGRGNWRTFLGFAGPGLLVSVGYMDPGNWATDIGGGAGFGYALLWVILLSNGCAILLQTLCVRLGVATGTDLARACREAYSKPVAITLWILAEIGIIACDLAEVIGSAVAIKLLTGGRIPLEWGVVITGLDVLILLGALRFGVRKLEAIVLALVATIAACFVVQLIYARPEWMGVLRGLGVPTLPPSPPKTPVDQTSLFISIGILGATVMPHNLYLHSSLVNTRRFGQELVDKARAIKWNTLDTVWSLSAAFFVNAAILVVAAATFHASGHFDVAELEDAYHLLTPLLGGFAATAFAVALLASGQSSTITGTLAGQVVMEGFLGWRIAPWLRRLISRGLAIVPALFFIHASGGKNTNNLLILSQIVLAMQLPFAVFPLVIFTSDARKMGVFVNPMWLKWTGYAIACLISAFNVLLLWQTVRGMGR